MKEYSIHREQVLPITLLQAWNFFSNPHNLQKITPPDMGFKIVTPLLDKKIFSGMRITYSVRPLLSLPLKWETEIKDVEEPYLFVDTQLEGPYKTWEHKHIFEEVKDGVKMIDHVVYSLPMGILGEFAHQLFVRKRLEQIFDYREKILIS
jgi:ligand-binding SRPBCC domain-containing protein